MNKFENKEFIEECSNPKEDLSNCNKEYNIDDLEEYGFQEAPVNENSVEYIEEEYDEDSVEYIEDYNAHLLETEEVDEILTASNIDIFRDEDTIKNILTDFKQDNWDDFSLEERKECIANLKEYIEETIGLENCPNLEFYNNADPGDYAYVTGDGSKIAINEYNLWNSAEAADSICHELWHAYQHQRANMMENEIDQAYAEGFDNYIGPDIDYQMYEDQFVESDAREFAQRIKDYMDNL